MDAAILFEAEAYRLDGPKLMGRQSAGNSFLRAAVNAHAGQPVWGFSPYSQSANLFQKTVSEIDPSGQTRWIGFNQLNLMADRGVLFRPDAELEAMAKLRLRIGAWRYSLCGMTHTMAGKPLIHSFPSYAVIPVAPWDAVICTSRAARHVVAQALETQNDYLAWRLGGAAPASLQLPIIPLGVHVQDFQFSPDDRAAARQTLEIPQDEVVALFAGRLSLHAKAHPFQMFAALQEVCTRTGRRITLVQAGKFPSPTTQPMFQQVMTEVCPDVRAVFVDGQDFARYRMAWAAADLFISLSDNIQETFGITPLEAMSAGLPVLASDWDGYRDTVRDGVDGFLIPTWAPVPGTGEHIARAFEAGDLNYDYMLFRTCVTVSLEAKMLVDRLTQLVADEGLRRRMGAAGRERARTSYDWSVIYRQYQALWDELTAIRLGLSDEQKAHWHRAPRNTPGHDDPFRAFSSFPTAWVQGDMLVRLIPSATLERYAAVAGSPLFQHWKVEQKIIVFIFERLSQSPETVAALAAGIGLEVKLMVEVISRMLKMQLVEAVHTPELAASARP
ncbi:MAG: glycosyltransferase family 4 protein [Phenylobacterium sp.]